MQKPDTPSGGTTLYENMMEYPRGIIREGDTILRRQPQYSCNYFTLLYTFQSTGNTSLGITNKEIISEEKSEKLAISN